MKLGNFNHIEIAINYVKKDILISMNSSENERRDTRQIEKAQGHELDTNVGLRRLF